MKQGSVTKVRVGLDQIGLVGLQQAMEEADVAALEGREELVPGRAAEPLHQRR